MCVEQTILWTRSPAINMISKKLRQINKLRTGDKRKTTPRKYREVWSSNYNADAPTKRIQRKQKSRVQVYRLAFYSVELHGGVYMATYFSTLHFGINNISVSCANSHLQIQNAVHHNHRAKADLHARTNIPGMTLRRLCIKAWIMYTWTNIDKAASYHANKQTKSTQFILHRARTWTRYVRKRNAWISVMFTL